MSFFGFDASLDRGNKNPIDEDLAVYTWGEQSYDGLGDALEEGGDELNDETFGGTGTVGKDFNFTTQTTSEALPSQPHHHYQHVPSNGASSFLPAENVTQSNMYPPSQTSHLQQISLESLWSSNGGNQTQAQQMPPVEQWQRPNHQAQKSTGSIAKFSPFDEPQVAQSFTTQQPRVRTLQEIEAEMRASAAQNRTPQASFQQSAAAYAPSLEAHQYHQQQHPQSIATSNIPPPLDEQFAMQMEQLERSMRVQQLSSDSQQNYRSRSPGVAFQQPVQHVHGEQFHQPQARRHIQQAPIDYAAQQMNQARLVQEQQQQELLQQQMHLRQLMSQAQFQHPMVGLIPQPSGQFPANLPIDEDFEIDPRIALGDPNILRTTMMLDQEQRNAVMGEAMRKIMEAEQMEEKRRRRAHKMARMARYNDLMTQSDKDFITRIQVSQLVTQDPYTEDFYAQVFGAILRARMGVSSGGEKSVLKIGGGGVGLGLPGQRGAGRRENAMQRMQVQVERIVSNAQARDKERGSTSAANGSLQNALGKVSGRSYKAAPRQLLQVNAGGSGSPVPMSAIPATIPGSEADHDGLTKTAAKLGREALSNAGGVGTDPSAVIRRPPLTHREIQVAVEGLYDSVLELEQMRRDAPNPETSPEEAEIWNSKYADLIEMLWNYSKVMIPVETSDPHPFISLLAPLKGKRLLPRLIRHLPENKVSLLTALFVACFYQLDVVRDGPILDDVLSQGASSRWKEVSMNTDVFLTTVLPAITGVLAGTSLRLLTGFLNIMLGTGKDAILQIAKSQPGIALLTAFMGRADQLKHESDEFDATTPEDWNKWQAAFDSLLNFLQGSIVTLFPSRRILPSLPQTPVNAIPLDLDLSDQIVWQLLAVLAALGTQAQQMTIVAELRDVILEIVQSVHSGWIPDEREATLKLANVNILLRAIGLDDSLLVAT